MPKPKKNKSTDINTAVDCAGDEIDRHFSTWLNGVENYVKALFVPDAVHFRNACNRALIEDAKQLAAIMGTELSVELFMEALEVKLTPELESKAEAITRAQLATRRQVAGVIGRDESKAWAADPSDRYGDRGASFTPDGVLTTLGPYWLHLRFIGDQLATMGLYPARLRHAEAGGPRKDMKPLSECL